MKTILYFSCLQNSSQEMFESRQWTRVEISAIGLSTLDLSKNTYIRNHHSINFNFNFSFEIWDFSDTLQF